MQEIYGWRGKILQVDLSNATITEDALSPNIMRDYLGGAGINAKLFYDIVRSNSSLDPLAPENPLIFGCGPVVGTSFPCSGRFTVTSKSPLTGIFGDSNAGGFFGARMKQAGYDHIVIRGKAERPVALVIEPGKPPRIADASDLWGLDTYATDKKIREVYGSGHESARIGPAGEHLVKYANILSGSKRVAANGRSGMGCVMGSKKLKAIIIKAEGVVSVADRRKHEELANLYWDIWGNGPATAAYKEYGTLFFLANGGELLPVKNEQGFMSPEQLEAYDMDTFSKKYKISRTGCYKCPIGCTQRWKITDGAYQGQAGDKFEYGHEYHLGPLLGIFDFPSVLHLADLTNRLGMDCNQFAWNLALSIECFENGILSSSQTDGMQLAWGATDLFAEIMKKIAYRQGFGNILAESMPDILSLWGPDAKPFGLHAKGMSFPYSWGAFSAMNLSCAVSTRGADHMKALPFSGLIEMPEVLEKVFGKGLPEKMPDPDSPVGKGRIVWWHENYKMLIDSLGICFFPFASGNMFGDPYLFFDEIGEIYQAVTGHKPAELFTACERAYQLERCYNALLGIQRKDDIRDGTSRGRKEPVDAEALDEYYHYRGCDVNGIPTEKRLAELGLVDVIADLTRAGTIAGTACPSIQELLPKGA